MRPPQPVPASRGQLPALTGVRFVAAFLVLLFHTAPASLREVPVLATLVAQGYVGVGCFFVLSGFVLAYNYPPGAPGADRRTFWARRFARVYPLYAVALLVSLPFLLHEARARPESWSAGKLALALITAPTLTQAWLPNAAACSWNCPGWSLSVEALFYATFPFLLPLVARRTDRGLLALVVALAAVALLPLLLFPVWGGVGAGNDALRNLVEYHPVFRLPEFAIGMSLGTLFARRSDRDASFRHWGALAGAATAGIVLVLLLAGRLAPSALHYGGPLAGLFAVFVYALANAPQTGVVGGRSAVLLGEASYALYILHMPIAEWWGSAIRRLPSGTWMGPASEPLGGTYGWLLYVVLTVSVSIVALRFIEDPARRWLRTRLESGRRRGRLTRAGRAPDVVAEP